MACFADSRVLIAHIGQKTSIEDSPVWFQHVLLKAKASMKKELIIFV